MILKLFIWTTIFFLLSKLLYAESLTLTMENDFFAHHDRYYTHGTTISYSFDYFIPNVPLYTNWNNQSSIILGQYIYTPSTIRKTEKIIGDRPYSGYLYIGYLVELRKNNMCDLWELDIGTSGENSLAGQIQTCIHKLLDNKLPLGWNTQVDEKLLGTISYYKKYKWKWNYADAIIKAGGAPLSNLNCNMGAGLQCRIGYKIPDDFGFKRMEPNIREQNTWSIYFIGDMDYRHLFYYYFLNDKIEEEYQIEKINNVLDCSYGIGISYGSMSIHYLRNYRTREFEQQDHHNEFGTVAFTFEF